MEVAVIKTRTVGRSRVNRTPNRMKHQAANSRSNKMEVHRVRAKAVVGTTIIGVVKKVAAVELIQLHSKILLMLELKMGQTPLLL